MIAKSICNIRHLLAFVIGVMLISLPVCASLPAPIWNLAAGTLNPMIDVNIYGADSEYAVYLFISLHPEVAMQLEYTVQAMGPLVESAAGRIGQWISGNKSQTVAAPNNVDDYLRIVDGIDVSTPRNGAVFYSGRGNRELAEQFAAQNGRTTLEMTPGGRWLDQQELFGPNSPLTSDEALQVWSRLSQRFADEASGNAVGFVRGARAESISIRLNILH